MSTRRQGLELVPGARFELARSSRHLLRMVCLPIPPPRHGNFFPRQPALPRARGQWPGPRSFAFGSPIGVSLIPTDRGCQSERHLVSSPRFALGQARRPPGPQPGASAVPPARHDSWSQGKHRGFHEVPPPLRTASIPNPSTIGADRWSCTSTVRVLKPAPLLLGYVGNLERPNGLAPSSEPWQGPILLLDDSRSIYVFHNHQIQSGTSTAVTMASTIRYDRMKCIGR